MDNNCVKEKDIVRICNEEVNVDNEKKQ